jgi:hypothetical protein
VVSFFRWLLPKDCTNTLVPRFCSMPPSTERVLEHRRSRHTRLLISKFRARFPDEVAGGFSGRCFISPRVSAESFGFVPLRRMLQILVPSSLRTRTTFSRFWLTSLVVPRQQIGFPDSAGTFQTLSRLGTKYVGVWTYQSDPFGFKNDIQSASDKSMIAVGVEPVDHGDISS